MKGHVEAPITQVCYSAADQIGVRDFGLGDIVVRAGSAAAVADVARAFKIVDVAYGSSCRPRSRASF